MLPRYHQVRIEVQAPHLASSDTTLAGSGGGALLLLSMQPPLTRHLTAHYCCSSESPDPHFSLIPPQCVCVCVCPCYSQAGVEVQTPCLAFANGVEVGPWFFPWSLARIEQLFYKIFLSCQVTHPQCFGQTKRAFLGAFLCVPVGVFRMLASLVPSLEYMKQKENSGNSLSCHFLGQGSLCLPSSLYCSEFSVCLVNM